MNDNTADELPCKEVVELVTDYLEQTLLAQMNAQVEAHLADCPGCTIYYEQVRQTIEVLRKLSGEPMLPATKEELLLRFREKHSS